MSYLSAILIVLGLSLLAGICVFIVRKCVHISFLQKHHEVAFTIFLQEGVIYGVLLAFSVSVVWGQFNQAAEEMQAEISNLLIVAQMSSVFPPPLRNDIDKDILVYMHSVLDREWLSMRKGELDLRTQQNFDQLLTVIMEYQPQSYNNLAIYSEVLKHLTNAREARRMRLFHSSVSVPAVIWVILVIMGILVITLPLFFGMEHQWSQAVITAGLTGMISAILLLIILLDNPFGKSLHVDKKIFVEGIRRIQQINLTMLTIPEYAAGKIDRSAYACIPT